MKIFVFSLLTAIVLIACVQHNAPVDKEGVKKEIAEAEKAFETMTKEKGVAEAFAYFADSNAVIRRTNDTLIKGKEAIRNFYHDDFYQTASVSWSPDFIDVSESGDMGYTYGKYIWRSKDSLGNTQELTGIFHTVWKRQNDGNWKYVWD